MAYVIVCKEPDIDAYVLPDGAESFDGAKQLMQSRAEEYIDEQTEVAVEADEVPGELCMDVSESAISIYPVVDGKRRPDVMTMNLQAVTIHG